MIESIVAFSGVDDLVRENVFEVDLTKYEIGEQNAIRLYYQSNTRYKRIVDAINHLTLDCRVPETETLQNQAMRQRLAELIEIEYSGIMKSLGVVRPHDTFDMEVGPTQGELKVLKANTVKLILHCLAILSMHGINDREILNTISLGLLELAK